MVFNMAEEGTGLFIPGMKRFWWGAQAPLWKEPLKIPLTHVRLTHTGTKTCTTEDDCCGFLQTIQKFYINEVRLADIPYNNQLENAVLDLWFEIVFCTRNAVSGPPIEQSVTVLSFMIGGDNIVYKGRGWFTEPARPPNLKWLASKCLDIAFIGNYEGQEPNHALMNLALDLISYGVKSGKISQDYKLIKLGDSPQMEL